ncbi:hypothetical protein HLB35_05500 [Halomonas sp. TBZ9]|uniref:Trimeric autotransporter adhesin n=1 Tax=Vreelandella azerica TaxID=2732867 RepID=A0A7Y3TWE1_9GAMM|nr:ESPR-type extended signal peptide-containing protein [Halomonas azerica]NOG31355.1 hypothetical protein [Halomonas azerica]
MNNVFRLIWNRTLGRLVVASEAARSRDKAATQHGAVGLLPAPEAAISGVPAFLRPLTLAVVLAALPISGFYPQGAQANLTTSPSAAGFALVCSAPGDQAVANGTVAFALGCRARAIGDYTTAIGLDSRASGYQAISVGNVSVASGYRAAAFGTSADALADRATAIGAAAQATDVRATAIGAGADASLDYSVALGSESIADRNSGVRGYDVSLNSAAIDGSAIALTEGTWGAVSVGDVAEGDFRQITGVAAGSADSDAVNVAQLKAVRDIASSGGVEYYSVNDGGVPKDNVDNLGASGLNALAAGTNASAAKEGSVAIGHNSTSEGVNGVAIGANTVNGDYLSNTFTPASNAGQVAIGDSAETETLGQIAIGLDAKSNQNGGNFSIAIGGRVMPLVIAAFPWAVRRELMVMAP